MPIVDGGNLVATADDDAAAEFRAELNTGINWVDNAHSAWPGMSNAEKQAWLLNNFDTVLLIILRLLKFVRGLVKRI